MNKHLFLFICILLLNQSKSQDSQFNNVNHSLIYLNPSFAGSEEYIRVQVDYRNQWPNLSGNYRPCFFSIDGFNKPIKGGIALSVINEDMGRATLNRKGIALSYSQYIKLTELITLITSFQGTLNRSALDRNRLNFNDMIDPRYGIYWPPLNSPTNDVPVPKIDYADVATGIILKYANYASIGASFSNLLEPNISHIGSYHLPVRTNLHASCKFIYNPRSTADVMLYSTFQNNYYNIRMNVISQMAYGITLGIGYGVNNLLWVAEGSNNRDLHNLRGFIGYTRSRFNILYSYDQYVIKNAAGSHELSLQVLFKKKASSKPSSIEDLK